MMRVLVAGAHGGIGSRLCRLLHDRGDEVVGTIRDGDQAEEIRVLGAEPVVCDVTGDVAAQLDGHLDGVEAVVYTIGAGPGSGPDPKWTVDKGGSDKLVALCEQRGIERYVIVSSIGAQDPSSADGDFATYLEAKRGADDVVRSSSLRWTVVRPGGLTDDEGDGRVRVSTELGDRAEIPRDDVAAVLAACLDSSASVHVTFEVFDGDVPADEAVASLGVDLGDRPERA